MRVPEALVEAAREVGAEQARVADLLVSGGGLVFGSRLLPGARTVDPAELATDEHHRRAILRILVFDLVVANRDRRLANPNVLLVDGALYAIDHAQAFPWLTRDAPALGAILREHIGRPFLDAGAYSRAELAEMATRLHDRDVQAAIADLPAGWRPRSVDLRDLRDTLMEHRDAVVRFLLQENP